MSAGKQSITILIEGLSVPRALSVVSELVRECKEWTDSTQGDKNHGLSFIHTNIDDLRVLDPTRLLSLTVEDEQIQYRFLFHSTDVISYQESLEWFNRYHKIDILGFIIDDRWDTKSLDDKVALADFMNIPISCIILDEEDSGVETIRRKMKQSAFRLMDRPGVHVIDGVSHQQSGHSTSMQLLTQACRESFSYRLKESQRGSCVINVNHIAQKGAIDGTLVKGSVKEGNVLELVSQEAVARKIVYRVQQEPVHSSSVSVQFRRTDPHELKNVRVCGTGFKSYWRCEAEFRVLGNTRGIHSTWMAPGKPVILHIHAMPLKGWIVERSGKMDRHGTETISIELEAPIKLPVNPAFFLQLPEREYVLAFGQLNIHLTRPEKHAGFEMIQIPSRTFMIGGPGKHTAGKASAQQVLTPFKSFLMGRYPVSKGQWLSIRGEQASNEDFLIPVTGVSFNEVQDFIKVLKRKTGKPFRLPSEFEWEYACRGLTHSAFWWGDSPESGLASAAFTHSTDEHNGDMENRTGDALKQGQYAPNSFGLFDMHGLVLEWCEDEFHPHAYTTKRGYKTNSSGNPVFKGAGDQRVCRGGAWNLPPEAAASHARHSCDRRRISMNTGFRLAMDCE